MIIGRDHAGVGDYYGPFDAQKIFLEIPEGALKCENLNIDWTFHCFKCGGMASMRTCPQRQSRSTPSVRYDGEEDIGRRRRVALPNSLARRFWKY